MGTGSGANASVCGGVTVSNAASSVDGVGGVSPISDAVSVVASDTRNGGACTPVFMCVSLNCQCQYSCFLPPLHQTPDAAIADSQLLCRYFSPFSEAEPPLGWLRSVNLLLDIWHFIYRQAMWRN
ncbi:hypothetical protein [Microcoleus sp. B4-D4]|uniref:hypothetical protein n=1 Tax=Microcoleus sp. B4-D4 TaxID=2818667 RepID=UPI002FCF418C